MGLKALMDKIMPGKPAPADAAAALGGAAGQAAANLSGRDYQLHVKEAQANGTQPLSPEEFAKQNQKK